MIVLTAALYAYGEFERVSSENALATRDRFDVATATAKRLEGIVATSTANGISNTANATAVAQVALEAARVSQSTSIAASASIRDSNGAGFSPNANSNEVVVPVVQSEPTSIPPVASPIPSPPSTPSRIGSAIKHITATTIGLNSAVVDSKIVNGEWQVPKFTAGYLQGTGLPGEGRNIVLSGHVQSLTSGNVFSRISSLNIGDDVTLRTADGDVVYRISGKSIVTPDDLSVLQSSGREELTLITCTGSFNFFTRDYSHRWIVWGDRLP